MNINKNTLFDFAVPMTQLVDDIAEIGHKWTIIMQGGMGWGKTESLNLLKQKPALKDHEFIYIDGTTKSDSGDFYMIKYSDTGETFTTVPHEELGMHLEQLGKHVVLFFDEIGKMPRSAFNAILRILYERKTANGLKLSDKSIVYAATNMAAEGLGDVLQAHSRNRCRVATVSVPTKMEWLQWAITNAVHEFVIGYANDNNFIFKSFLEHNLDAQGNSEHPEIYDPRTPEPPVAFVTGRSLAHASDYFHLYDARIASAVSGGHFSQDVEKNMKHNLKCQLAGVVGPKAATDMLTYFSLQKDLPTEEDIINTPMTAKIPKGGAARALLMARSLKNMRKELAAPWMKYLMREGAGEFTKVDQAVFGMGANVKGYHATKVLARDDQYQKWAEKNFMLFGKA